MAKKHQVSKNGYCEQFMVFTFIIEYNAWENMETH